MAISQPNFIATPWAQSGQFDQIPDTQATPGDGRASWATGFPPENTIPVSQGGVPSNYLDFQGVLNALSSFAWYQQRGGLFTWSNQIDYPIGSIVLASNGKTYQAVQASGPGETVGAKNPTSNAAYWYPSETSTALTGIGNVTGCAVFASGLKIQWGQEAPTAQLEVTYSTPFTYNPVVILTPNANAYTWVTGLGTTSFKINSSSYSSINVRWLAIGI